MTLTFEFDLDSVKLNQHCLDTYARTHTHTHTHRTDCSTWTTAWPIMCWCAVKKLLTHACKVFDENTKNYIGDHGCFVRRWERTVTERNRYCREELCRQNGNETASSSSGVTNCSIVAKVTGVVRLPAFIGIDLRRGTLRRQCRRLGSARSLVIISVSVQIAVSCCADVKVTLKHGAVVDHLSTYSISGPTERKRFASSVISSRLNVAARWFFVATSRFFFMHCEWSRTNLLTKR